MLKKLVAVVRASVIDHDVRWIKSLSGVQVEIWDCGPIFEPKHFAAWQPSSLTLCSHRAVHSLTELDQLVSRLSEHDALLINAGSYLSHRYAELNAILMKSRAIKLSIIELWPGPHVVETQAARRAWARCKSLRKPLFRKEIKFRLLRSLRWLWSNPDKHYLDFLISNVTYETLRQSPLLDFQLVGPLTQYLGVHFRHPSETPHSLREDCSLRSSEPVLVLLSGYTGHPDSLLVDSESYEYSNLDKYENRVHHLLFLLHQANLGTDLYLSLHPRVNPNYLNRFPEVLSGQGKTEELLKSAKLAICELGSSTVELSLERGVPAVVVDLARTQPVRRKRAYVKYYSSIGVPTWELESRHSWVFPGKVRADQRQSQELPYVADVVQSILEEFDTPL